MITVGVLAGLNNWTANIYTLENYNMYMLMFSKPWGKLHLHGLGILAAIFYFDLLGYRKLDSNFDKKRLYPKIHFLSNNIKLAKILMLIGVTLVVTNFFVTYVPG